MKRRDFLKVMGASAGAALAGSTVIEALAAPDLPNALRYPALADSQIPVWHILNRLTFGPRPGQVDAVGKMGWQAYLEQQLAPETINDDASENRLGDYITLDMTAQEMIAYGKDQGEAIRELDSATVMRAIYSERQLYEIMVNFWSEHFSICHLKETCKIFKTIDDREVIRKYALGKFRDLLGASAKSPAMLIYLDNAESNKSHPNENYAREVMELHTLSVGNYMETDVKEVARCFTGWTVAGPRKDNAGEFIFDPKLHDDGAKTVLGHQIAAGGGQQDGETVLDILASHPMTAQLICNKLARRFIADDPPQNVIDAAAKVFLSSGGDIKAVLRVILGSDEFLSAPPKFKRPFEYVISLFRAFDVDIQELRPQVLGILKTMGHLPFDHITPDGYSDVSTNWEANMLLRWNAAIQVVYGAVPKAVIDLNTLIRNQNVEIAPRPILDFFATHLLGRQFTQAELDAIWNFASKNGMPDLSIDKGRKRTIDAIALIAASPAFQYR